MEEELEEKKKDVDNLIKKGKDLFTGNQFLESETIWKKVIQLLPDYLPAYFYLTNICIIKEEYQRAIFYLEKEYELAPENVKDIITKSLISIYIFWTVSLIKENKIEEAKFTVQQSGCSTIRFFSYLGIGISKEEKYMQVAAFLKDPLFDHLISEDDKYQKEYKSIYLKSLYIVSLLHVNKEEENKVAHYTQKTVVEKLLIKENGKDQVSPFRLNTVATANDPKEGMPLLSYLGIEKDSVSEDYQAFVGSFIFNPDSLNQFRLYGKKDNQEATGVSIVVSKDYFSEETTPLRMIKDAQIDMKVDTLPDDNEKQALYRCIYLDPKTSQVISVGHKEEYTFYREQDKVLKKTIKEYNKYRREIDKLIEEVRENLADLREEIELLMEQIEKDFKAESRQKEEKRNAQTKIATLLTHLRYLTKHVAFKEEQECRVISVERLRDNDKIQTEDNARMFIDYLPMRNGDQCYVTDVYFAPRTTGFELFKNILKNNGIDIPCHQCDHPFI